ncbi:MAG TPA: sigma-70 family RNA polymerase sigma factor [Actinomycetota bacterium]|nr:sigma-70 family RNA polymerase sigma factor [Actinomycetota bacterium]
MTERLLVQAAQAGLPEATDELVERYYARVYSFVAMQHSGDVEDLTQEVFARALGALPRFNGEYQFGAWLIQIARNVCIDEARRQSHRPQPTDPVDLVDLEPAHAQPDDVWESVSSQIAVSTVHRALARLPKRQRTVLVLREFEGMSYADIAVSLMISTRAVEISLSRARKRLRLELKRLEAAEGELAACRRCANLLASDPSAASQAEVADHLRQCLVCQTTVGRRKARPNLHAAWGVMVAGSAGLAQALKRQAHAGTRLVQSFVVSQSTTNLSPLSRLAEVGAAVAVATAVSAGSFSPPATPAASLPVATPIVLPAQAVPIVIPDTPATAPNAPALSAGSAEIIATDSSATSQGTTCVAPPAGSSASASPLATGLDNLLQPVLSLTSSIACPTLGAVGNTVAGLNAGLQSGAAKTQNGAQQLIDGLLNLTAPHH